MHNRDRIAISSVAREYERRFAATHATIDFGGTEEARRALQSYTAGIRKAEMTPAIQAAFRQVSADLSSLHAALGDKQAEVDRLSAMIAALDDEADLDEALSLRGAAAFTRELERMIAYAGGHGHPLSLVLIRVERPSRARPDDGAVLSREEVLLVARAMAARTRRSDLMGRLGDGLFGVVLMDADLDRAALIAGRILDTIASSTAGSEAPDPALSAAFGLCPLDATIDAQETLVRAEGDLHRRPLMAGAEAAPGAVAASRPSA